jgi:hypothetical protein
MIYRALLRLYPYQFRRQFGDELEADFLELCREARESGERTSLLRCWHHALTDLLISIPREWCRTVWPPVLGAAALVACGIFYYVVGRIYRVRAFASDAQPPESPQLLLLMALMALVPAVGMFLIAVARGVGRRRAHGVRRRV